MSLYTHKKFALAGDGRSVGVEIAPNGLLATAWPPPFVNDQRVIYWKRCFPCFARRLADYERRLVAGAEICDGQADYAIAGAMRPSVHDFGIRRTV